jgi:serine/threonine protein kinase
MPATPESIGKYKIEKELGSGASSVVYLAYDAFNRQHVAVKQIHGHLLKDETTATRYRKTLRNEALLAGQLRHPYIVRLFDADEDAEPPYLVLEYLDGQSLAGYATADKLLPVSQVLDIGFKCCSALDHAHSRGLVHRDIKPANIMLQANGNVKITDFGTAMSVRGDQTQLMGLVGSPCYMSPEQVREEQVTHHSDMFALGVVLYELLTGRRPFEGDSDFATMYKIGTETPRPPSALRPGLPDEIDGVIAKALSKKPEDRYPDWSEFADALLFVNKQIPVKRERDREAERFAQMRTLPFFSGFHDAALWEALRLGTMHNHPAGETLMRENTPGESFLVILDGTITVSRNGKKLATLQPGTTLGEMCYLQPDNQMRTATATAETEVAVLEIRNTSLRQASDDLQNRFDKAFIHLVVSRLIATTQKLDAVTAAEDAGGERNTAKWLVDKLNTKVF